MRIGDSNVNGRPYTEAFHFFLSNSRISYTVERHLRELTLKDNIRNLRGRQYLLWDGQKRVGVIKHDGDFGAEIDLPPEIPLAVQVFIYKLAFIMWQRWRWGGGNVQGVERR